MLVTGLHPTVLEFLRHSALVGVGHREHRIEAKLIAEAIGDEDVQTPVAPLQSIVQTSRESRLRRTFILQEAQMVVFLEVDVGGCDLAILVDDRGRSDLRKE